MRWANGETDPVRSGRACAREGISVTSTTDQNKAVVLRFMTEVLEGGKFDAIDEVLAPNYVTRRWGAPTSRASRRCCPHSGR
jgi:hypothetical protein